MKRNGNLSFEYFEHDKIWIMYDKEEYKKLIIITWTLIKVYWYISKGLKGGNNGFSMEKNEKQVGAELSQAQERLGLANWGCLPFS